MNDIISGYAMPGNWARLIVIPDSNHFHCWGCGTTETIMGHPPMMRILNRATLHNITAHRDGYMIRDDRFPSEARVNIQRKLESSRGEIQTRKEISRLERDQKACEGTHATPAVPFHVV